MAQCRTNKAREAIKLIVLASERIQQKVEKSRGRPAIGKSSSAFLK